MSLSNLQLETYFIDEIQCKANPNFNKNEPLNFDGLDVTFEAGTNSENPLLRRIKLTIQQESALNKKYQFKLILIGIFLISESFAARTKDKELEELVNTNCPSMLYSAAREIILSLTGRCPHGSLLLPTVSFTDFEPNEKE